MPLTLGSLKEATWTQGAHPLEWKKVDPSFPLVARLRFAPGFADPNWCTASHLIHVESGTLSLEVQDPKLGECTVTLGAGQFIHLTQGTPHRAKNPGETMVELFIVSHLEQLGAPYSEAHLK